MPTAEPGATVERLFTNRDEHLRAFAGAIEAKKDGRRRVLAFRGMGGVGKSALSVELGRALDGTSDRAAEIGLSGLATETGDLPCARITFEDPDLRTAPRALFKMQQKLYADHGIRFPKFSLAYGIYWSKKNPNTELKRASFLQKGDLLATAIDAWDVVMPGASFARAVPELLLYLGQKYRDWNLKTSDEALRNLAGKSARDVAAELPTFWADDLARERGTKGLQAVLFLDTHEALHTGDRSASHYHDSDRWVREWIEAVPGALWVVTGRDRLDWHEDDAKWEGIVTERLVENLTPKYVRQMLAAAGIDDEAAHWSTIERLYENLLDRQDHDLEENHDAVATTLNNLAGLYLEQGKDAEAEPLCKRALEILEAALGPSHPHVGTTLNNLAELYRAQGKVAEAEPLCKRALEIREAALGPSHPHVAQALNNLAGLCRAQGTYAEAEPLFERALKILEEGLGPDHPNAKIVRSNLDIMRRERDEAGTE